MSICSLNLQGISTICKGKYDQDCIDTFLDMNLELVVHESYYSPSTVCACKHTNVGWHVMWCDQHDFWILIKLLSLLDTSVVWHGDNFQLISIQQVMNLWCKFQEAFLYAQFHPM